MSGAVYMVITVIRVIGVIRVIRVIGDTYWPLVSPTNHGVQSQVTVTGARATRRVFIKATHTSIHKKIHRNIFEEKKLMDMYACMYVCVSQLVGFFCLVRVIPS